MTDVNTKVSGWIEKLYVNYEGQRSHQGSGASAAMFKALLQTSVVVTNDLTSLMDLINIAFCRVSLDEDFASAGLARWDRSTRVLTFVSAGHEPAYLMRAKGETQLLDSTGSLVGVDEAAEWNTIDFAVGPGDRLVLVADGLAETASPSATWPRASPEGKLFGRERLAKLLEENRTRTKALVRTQPLDVLHDNVLKAIRAHRGAALQTDDVTMLVIEF